MSDAFDTAEAVDTDAAIASDKGAPAERPSREPTRDIDVDALLGEFDRATKRAGEGGEPSAPAASEHDRPDTRGYSEDDLMRMQLGEVTNRVVLQSVLDHQIAHAERLHQEQVQRQEREDFDETVEEAARMIEGVAHIGDPKDFARRWLLAEAQLNPRLHEAWQHRRDSAEHHAFAVSQLKNAFKSMRKAVDRMPDPEATEDRWAVTAAMRGPSNRPPPAEDGKAYARRVERMTDAEFRQHRDEVMGQ